MNTYEESSGPANLLSAQCDNNLDSFKYTQFTILSKKHDNRFFLSETREMLHENEKPKKNNSNTVEKNWKHEKDIVK